jgi:hypothetical protein
MTPSMSQVGGVCIADEVQVGFGRCGTHMWAFETQDVVPDIGIHRLEIHRLKTLMYSQLPSESPWEMDTP